MVTKERTHLAMDTTESLKVVLCEFSEADGLQEIALPALGTAVDPDWDMALLADNAAPASVLIASRHMRKSVCQVVEFAFVEEFLRHVVLQPEDLGNLHLN